MTISSDEAERIADAYTKAWNSGSPEAVASFYAVDGSIVINNGDPWEGRSAVAAMAAGFYADVPDIHVVCEQLRYAGDHLAYLWRFTGTHSGTKNRLNIVGWEEWDMDADHTVKSSRGWFDSAEYARQVAGS